MMPIFSSSPSDAMPMRAANGMAARTAAVAAALSQSRRRESGTRDFMTGLQNRVVMPHSPLASLTHSLTGSSHRCPARTRGLPDLPRDGRVVGSVAVQLEVVLYARDPRDGFRNGHRQLEVRRIPDVA